MYICEDCKQLSQPREKANRVVTQTRQARYFHKYRYNDKDSIKVGEGTQIAKEVIVCTNCANQRKAG